MSVRRSAAEELAQLFAPHVLDLLERLIDERVEARLAALPTRDTGARWLTMEQAADRLGCSVDAVRMRAKRGRLEVRRQGRRVYVSAAGVDLQD